MEIRVIVTIYTKYIYYSIYRSLPSFIISSFKYFYRAKGAAALLHSKTAEYTQSARIALSLRLSRHLLLRLIRLPGQIYCDGF